MLERRAERFTQLKSSAVDHCRQGMFSAALVFDKIDQWRPRLSLSTLPRLALAASGAGVLAASQEALNAQAAGLDCTVRKFIVYGLGAIDHPVKTNQDGIIDTVDLLIDDAVAFRGGFKLSVPADLQNPYSQRKEFDGNMVSKGDYAKGELANLVTTANTKSVNGKDAVKFFISFPGDPIRQPGNPQFPPELPVVIECGQDGVAWGNRYPTEAAINKKADNATVVYSVGARIDQLMEEDFGKGRKLGLTPSGDNPQQNLKDLKDNLPQVISHAEKVRKGERAAATPQPEATPTPKPGVTATATATETPKGNGGGGAAQEGPSWTKGVGDAVQAVVDWPARTFWPALEQPWRTGFDALPWLLAVFTISGLTDRRARAAGHRRFGFDHLGSRVRASIVHPFHEIGYRRRRMLYRKAIAAGINPAAITPPTRAHRKMWDW